MQQQVVVVKKKPSTNIKTGDGGGGGDGDGNNDNDEKKWNQLFDQRHEYCTSCATTHANIQGVIDYIYECANGLLVVKNEQKIYLYQRVFLYFVIPFLIGYYQFQVAHCELCLFNDDKVYEQIKQDPHKIQILKQAKKRHQEQHDKIIQSVKKIKQIEETITPPKKDLDMFNQLLSLFEKDYKQQLYKNNQEKVIDPFVYIYNHYKTIHEIIRKKEPNLVLLPHAK